MFSLKIPELFINSTICCSTCYDYKQGRKKWWRIKVRNAVNHVIPNCKLIRNQGFVSNKPHLNPMLPYEGCFAWVILHKPKLLLVIKSRWVTAYKGTWLLLSLAWQLRVNVQQYKIIRQNPCSMSHGNSELREHLLSLVSHQFPQRPTRSTGKFGT